MNVGTEFNACMFKADCISKDEKLKSAMSQIEELTKQLEEAKKVAATNELRAIGELIRTQDNRITDAPIFIVQQQVEEPCDEDRPGGFESQRIVWYYTNGDGDVSELRASRLEKLYRKRYRYGFEEIPEQYGRCVMGLKYEYVTACFTDEGAKQYLRVNGHNLRSPRIYAEGSYRNVEYRLVRNWLMSLPPVDAVNQEG